MSELPENFDEASDGGLRTTALFGFFERWEAVRDENWNSGDYTKQSLGSRTDTMLKELREVMARITAAIGEIVVPTGEDSGVVLLSNDAPTHIEEVNGQIVGVYDHDHFSPLGDALVALHRMSLPNSVSNPT